MSVVIIDYGSGNLRSAAKAFERMAAESGGNTEVRVTGRAAELDAASHIVLPGVGAFGDCLRGLTALDGMRAALERNVIERGKPFLGICVGMQLMARRGFEHGTHEGFGWIDGEVLPLEPVDKELKIPHMGWNELELAVPDHPMFDGLGPGAHAYFVHSFAMQCARKEDVLARIDYGGPVVAAVGRDNMVGTQFHPEKSQSTGLRLIRNFLDWRP